MSGAGEVQAGAQISAAHARGCPGCRVCGCVVADAVECDIDGRIGLVDRQQAEGAAGLSGTLRQGTYGNAPGPGNPTVGGNLPAAAVEPRTAQGGDLKVATRGQADASRRDPSPCAER